MDLSELEKLLAKLPQYEMRNKKERLFYARLRELAKSLEREEIGTLTRRFAPLRVFAYATLAVFALFIATVGFSVSPEVTRGHFLYQIKQLEERVEFSFAKTPEARVKAHMRFADRRLDELDNLFKENPELSTFVPAAQAHVENDELDPRIHETIDDYFEETSKASNEVLNVAEADQLSAVLEILEQTEAGHVRKLENLLQKVAQMAEPLLTEVLITVEEHQAEVIERKVEVLRRRQEGEKRMAIQVKVMERLREEIRQARREGKLNFEERRDRALEELKKARETFDALKDTLPESERSEAIEKFESFLREKLEEAEEAFEEGRFGKVFGLSRATQGMAHRLQADEKQFLEEKKRGEVTAESFRPSIRPQEESTAPLEELQKEEPAEETPPLSRREQLILLIRQRMQELEITREADLESKTEEELTHILQYFENFHEAPTTEPEPDPTPPTETTYHDGLVQKILFILKEKQLPVPEHLREMSTEKLEEMYHMLITHVGGAV